MQGRNVKKLIIRRMSMLMVPAGGSFADGVNVLSASNGISTFAREATEWVNAAIDEVKAASDNPYGNDDETIAGEILRQIEKKK